MSASNYLENKMLDHVFGNTPYTPPATIYVALHTADPTEAGSVGEVSGGSYARVGFTNNTTSFPNASGGSKSNGVVGTFPTPTVDWGDVTYWSMWDAASGGNCLVVSAAFTAQPCRVGNTVTFANGALVITAD